MAIKLKRGEHTGIYQESRWCATGDADMLALAKHYIVDLPRYRSENPLDVCDVLDAVDDIEYAAEKALNHRNKSEAWKEQFFDDREIPQVRWEEFERAVNKVLTCCREIQRHIAQDDMAYAVFEAFSLGRLLEECIIRHRDERYAARGVKQRNSAKEGHAKRHGTAEQKKTRWEGYQTDVDRYRRDHRWSYTQACRKVAKKNGVHFNTVERRTTRK